LGSAQALEIPNVKTNSTDIKYVSRSINLTLQERFHKGSNFISR